MRQKGLDIAVVVCEARWGWRDRHGPGPAGLSKPWDKFCLQPKAGKKVCGILSF